MGSAISIIHRPVKHARLRVKEDTSVQLIVPNDFDPQLIDTLVQKKAGWIARQQQFFRARKPSSPPLCQGEALLFGQAYRVVEDPALKSRVQTDATAREIRSGRDLTRKQELLRWYRSFARQYLRRRISELSTKHRLPFNRLFIRSQRTKWGSCSAKSNISLNWRLILTPPHVIDYVILHELLHTRIPNHSQTFWLHLNSICPDAGEAMRWLRQQGDVAPM